MQSELRGLTLWRPWLHAIFRAGKDVENRPWKPWKSVVGKFIALHAGAKYDKQGAHWMEKQGLYVPPQPGECPAGVIQGVAKVVDYIHKDDLTIPESVTAFSELAVTPLDDNEPVHPMDNPWFFGPFGWLLDDITELPEPVPCRGARGLWIVPDDVREKVRAGYLKAVKGQGMSIEFKSVSPDIIISQKAEDQ